MVTLVGRFAVEAIPRVMRERAYLPDENLLACAFDAVRETWRTADEETRAAVVDALFRLDGDRAVEFLDEVLNDPDPWLRIHVIEVIAAIADKRAPELIARFAEDEDDLVRDVALTTLQSRGYAGRSGTAQ
jgi:HEAT repeat protein